MRELHPYDLEDYLGALHAQPVRVLALAPLGEALQAGAVKGYGYGLPVRIEYEAGGQRRHAVLETVSPGPFGHEDMADRAQQMLWDHASFGKLPRHVRALDVGGFRKDGALQSAGKLEEYFLLVEYVEGQGYYKDLIRLRDGGKAEALDTARADALCDYLVEIHKVAGSEPGRYVRRIREVLGHGECIMGLTDSYPEGHAVFPAERLQRIEHHVLDWRYRLRGRKHRLRQVHGDFHPWNVLFREGVDFSVLDRARGEWGEAADDVVSMTMNYLFFSLQRSGRLEGDLGALFQRFWARYLSRTGDREVLEVAAPFIAFRGLVMASPLWYPDLDESVRRKLAALIERVLEEPAFQPERVNEYLGER